MSAFSDLTIKRCLDRASLQEFENLPEELHGRHPAFTPPFPGSVAKFLHPRSHFHQQDGTITAFLVQRKGRTVGRVAAIHNRSALQYLGDGAGYFGFFSCIDDADVARCLIGLAAEELAGRGCKVMRGPYNPTIHDDCGVLIEGTEFPPHISMPWNPAYYGGVLERVGLQVERKLLGYHLDLTVEVPARVRRITERVRKRQADFSIRPMNLRKLPDELRLAHRLYNLTLDRNSGFYPISLEDLLASAGDLQAFADPEFLTFCELNGEQVAFMFTLPNFNEILHRTRGVPRILRLPWIFLLMKTHKIRTVRQVILGLHPDHRDHGLAALMCDDMVQRTRRTAHAAQLSWIESNNKEVIPLIEAMGAKQTHLFHLYKMEIAEQG
jgi:GNAT superfamily N-acetyltransferase